jgi:AraC-like DNA-binding protein
MALAIPWLTFSLMLRYVNNGERRYGQKPVAVTRRLNWEFEAVLQGRMAPLLPDGAADLRTRTLWVFPPTSAHGWTGDGDRPCEITVIQVATAPDPLRALALSRGFLAVPLEPRDVEWLRATGEELTREQAAPTALGGLLTMRAVSELCLIALRNEPVRRLAGELRGARDVAASALAWYAEHLAEDPPLARVAEAVGASASHLRRLFHRALGKSPHAALQGVRFERAHDLMRDQRLTLEAVAAACGFSDASAFSRAYRQWHGHPPSRWRQELV